MVIYSPGVKSWAILLSKKCATIKQKVISTAIGYSGFFLYLMV